MNERPCPFCEIVSGSRSQEVVYSDETVVAFLNNAPATTGHTLVVPREHRCNIWDIQPHEATAAMAVARLLATVARETLGALGVNLRQNNGSLAGQDVFHFHVHLVPRYENDTVLPGCVWGIPPWVPPANDPAERERVADTIRAGLDDL